MLLALAFALDTVPPASLERAVRGAISAAWSVPASTIRLAWGRIPSTDTASNVAAEIVGRSIDGWMVIRVAEMHGTPVALRVRAGLDRSLPVAARALPAGRVIASDDVSMETRVVWGNAEFRVADVNGWLVRRAISAGEPITPPAAEAPRVVAAGESLRLTWTRGEVSIVMEGKSLTAGAVGETVTVESNGQRRAATVTGPGRATLNDSGSS